MDLSFKEKCISIALSISLGAFVPSAAFASQDFYQQPKSAAAFRIRSAIGTPNGQRLSQA